MSNFYDRNRPAGHNPNRRSAPRAWEPARDEDPNEERNMWQSRTEDGGWAQQHQNDTGSGDGAIRFERGNERRFSDAEYDRAASSPRRGYGTEVFGESGLGETDYSHGFGPNHGFGYPREFPERRGGFPGTPSAGAGGYGQGSSARRVASEYNPTGLDRDRLGAGGNQGYGRQYGGHAGRGPKDYQRADSRILEDVCERLSRDDEVDASELAVRVEGGEVTLEGSVETRRQKRQAEHLAADVPGVKDVHVRVRVEQGILSELKAKVTGEESPSGGHAGSGTKTTLGTSLTGTGDQAH